MSEGRSARPPRRGPAPAGRRGGAGASSGRRPPASGGARPGSRAGRSARPDGHRAADEAGRTPRRSAGRPSPRPSGGRSDERPGRGTSGRRPATPLTAAQQRAAEVAARRGPRIERDPASERARIEGRTLETWIDEGAADVRAQAAGAAARAASEPRRRHETRSVDPDIAADIRSASADRRRGDRLVERFADAHSALERDRLDEARRLATALVRELPGVAQVHELAGLVAYRLGRWRDAVRELEAAQQLGARVDLLPMLADSYRALKRWTEVERIWAEVREISPAHEVMAEARIVAAGAQADRGDLTGALKTMASAATAKPKRVREHHLRQWYVLGDLHDRAGNPIEAARWFDRVAHEDPGFVDVTTRLRSLGR